MNEDTTPRDGDPYCDRVRLLLSMLIDGEATPEQRAEAEQHLAGCADCQTVHAVDLAVRAHVESALAALPSGALATTMVSLVRADLRATQSANRFLLFSAAAAVLVAVSVGALSGGRRQSAAAGGDADFLDQARASTRLVVSAPAAVRGR